MRIAKLTEVIKKTDQYEKLLQICSVIAGSRPFQLFFAYKENIAVFLHMVWLAGCGYWIYKIITVDAQPNMRMMIIAEDPTDAMIFIYFGIFGVVYAIAILWFVIKFIYNLLQSGLYSLFSTTWYSLGKPLCYLLLLSFAFSYTGNIKAAGLTFYFQVTHMMNVTKQRDEHVQKSVDNIKKLLKDLNGHLKY